MSLSGIMRYGCFSYFSSLRNVDYFRFLYVGVMVCVGDQETTTQKPNPAQYCCFIILLYFMPFIFLMTS